MQFLGIDVGEWMALIGIISAIISVITWAMKFFVIDPLSRQIQNLSNTIKNFNDANNRHYQEQQEHLTHVDDRIDKHDVILENHKSRIHNLEHLENWGHHNE